MKYCKNFLTLLSVNYVTLVLDAASPTLYRQQQQHKFKNKHFFGKTRYRVIHINYVFLSLVAAMH